MEKLFDKAMTLSIEDASTTSSSVSAPRVTT